MYDSIQAVLTSQLRYRALWNESTATKTAMSYQRCIVHVPKHGDRCEAVAEVEIAPRCPALRHRESSREAASGRSHVYQRAKHATGISLALGIVPKAHTGAHGAAPGGAPFEENPSAVGAPKPTDFGRLLARYH